MKSGKYAINIWSRSYFYPVSEKLSIFYVRGCPTYVLEPNLHNTGVNIKIGSLGFKKYLMWDSERLN